MNQLFISYARNDNAAPPDEAAAKGFVDWLYGQIQWRLSQFPEPRPKVWRDTRQIDAAEQFTKELEDALAASDILVVVLSPNWLQRPWCLRELEAFAASHRALGDDKLRERIVCVIKSHVPPSDRPSLLQGQEGYKFFDVAEDNNQETEYFRGRPLNDKCVQLADGLTRHVYELAGKAPPPPPPPVPSAMGSSKRSVFVAWPASDMENVYETVVQELTARGFAVVPPPLTLVERMARLPNAASAATYLDEALQHAECSIHLLGGVQGFAPENAQPLAALQLLSAARRLRAQAANGDGAPATFQRLIWAPKCLGERSDQADRDPLAVLKSMDPDSLRPGDKVEGDVLPKFVQFVLERLETRSVTNFAGGAADVYLRFQDGQFADLQLAINVAEELCRAGMKADLTPIDPDDGREAFHRQRLRECDAVLFCWMQASDTWIRNNTNDLLRWKEFGRDKPFACGSVIMAPPPKISKDAYKALRPGAVKLIEVSEPPLTAAVVAPLIRLLTEGAP